jgi:NAD-dependent dihydropyrimidine dehydrogenase PreA subunit
VDIDDRLIVVDADACTGCRLCELLCPDFAISIAPPLEAAAARTSTEGIGLR